MVRSLSTHPGELYIGEMVSVRYVNKECSWCVSCDRLLLCLGLQNSRFLCSWIIITIFLRLSLEFACIQLLGSLELSSILS